LRDEGEAYAKRLQDAGVGANLTRYDSMIHGFTDLAELKQTQRAVDEAAYHLRRAWKEKTSQSSGSESKSVDSLSENYGGGLALRP
jgi:dienelactone hydrolase